MSTKDYMLTVVGGLGARDVQVNNAETIYQAMEIAERITGCPVDHGRSGILPLWDPAVIIDAQTGDVIQLHDRVADASMMIVNHAKAKGVHVPRG